MVFGASGSSSSQSWMFIVVAGYVKMRWALRATSLIGVVKRFAEFCGANAPESVVAGVLPAEGGSCGADVGIIDGWLVTMEGKLGNGPRSS